jgi:hypothetical protein
MRSLRSAGFLIPAKTILVPCNVKEMTAVEECGVRLEDRRQDTRYQGTTIEMMNRAV